MEAITAPRMVPGYRHVPGNHCGSTALRNLLAFHGAEISEEMALGLGAGVSFYYVALDGSSPSRFTNGRVGRLEEQFVELTGAPIRLDTFADPDASWEAARAAVDAGRPAILLTDLYYLDHYGSSAHFPGHAVVLAGYDAEVAYLSDTSFEELQTTRLDNLARARHGKHPVFPLDGHMFTVPEGAEPGDVRGGLGGRDRAKRAGRCSILRWASTRACRRCAGSPPRSATGPSEVEDWQWCARFCYQVIERRGTGGGNFRLMYSRFLDEAGRDRRGWPPRRRRGGRRSPRTCWPRARPTSPEPELWSRVGARGRRGARRRGAPLAGARRLRLRLTSGALKRAK